MPSFAMPGPWRRSTARAARPRRAPQGWSVLRLHGMPNVPGDAVCIFATRREVESQGFWEEAWPLFVWVLFAICVFCVSVCFVVAISMFIVYTFII